jgi:hypothetical protein
MTAQAWVPMSECRLHADCKACSERGTTTFGYTTTRFVRTS